jgi:hypothetical protein
MYLKITDSGLSSGEATHSRIKLDITALLFFQVLALAPYSITNRFLK